MKSACFSKKGFTLLELNDRESAILAHIAGILPRWDAIIIDRSERYESATIARVEETLTRDAAIARIAELVASEDPAADLLSLDTFDSNDDGDEYIVHYAPSDENSDGGTESICKIREGGKGGI